MESGADHIKRPGWFGTLALLWGFWQAGSHMSTINRISRRDFLLVTPAIAAVSVIALTSGQTALASPQPDGAHHLLPLRGRTGAIIAAERYFSLYPRHAEPAALQALIQADLAAHRGDLKALIKDDFCANRTMLADGWMLSLTEARLCALATFANAA